MPDTYYAEAAARHMKRPVLEMLSSEIDNQHQTLDELFMLPRTSARDLAEAHLLRSLAHDLEVRALCLRAQGAR